MSSKEAEEVELIDYLRVIWRRRKLVFLMPALSVIIAGVVSLMLPPLYEATAQVRIGRVWEKEIESPYLIVERVDSDAFLSRVIEQVNLPTTPYRMKKGNVVEARVLEGGSTGQKVPLLISIQAHANDPKQAVEIANTVASILTEDHKRRFEEKLNEYLAYEKELSREVVRIEEQMRDLENMIKKQQMNPSVNAPSVILLQAQLEQKNAQFLNFKKELKDVRINNTSSIITEDSKLIAPPILPKESINPRIKLNMAVAGAVSLFLTLILAFFLEYLDQVRIRENKILFHTSDSAGS